METFRKADKLRRGEEAMQPGTTSNLKTAIEAKREAREEIERQTAEFLKWKRNKIEVLPPHLEKPLPDPVQPKATSSASKKKKNRVPPKTKTATRANPAVKYDARNAAILDGLRFGKLVALYALEERSLDRQKIWHCLCDCGKTVDYRTAQLTKNVRTDCGRCDEPEIKTMGEVLKRQKAREQVEA